MLKVTVFMLLLVSGVAIACSAMLPLPIPPVPVKISTTDIVVARLKGYTVHAAQAAAMMKLDELGEKAVGKDMWRSNSYGGYFTYSYSIAGMTGVNNIPVEKGCDQKFIDNVEKSYSSGGGGGGDTGGMCSASGSDYGIVGWSSHSQRYTVCSFGSCTSGIYTEFSPIYGNIPHEKESSSIC